MPSMNASLFVAHERRGGQQHYRLTVVQSCDIAEFVVATRKDDRGISACHLSVWLDAREGWFTASDRQRYFELGGMIENGLPVAREYWSLSGVGNKRGGLAWRAAEHAHAPMMYFDRLNAAKSVWNARRVAPLVDALGPLVDWFLDLLAHAPASTKQHDGREVPYEVKDVPLQATMRYGGEVWNATRKVFG